MVLVSAHEEEYLFDELIDYYKKLYPKINFKKERGVLTKKQIGDVLYTYSGEEIEAGAKIKMKEIEDAISYGYDTPVIILKKKTSSILIDGHRRLRLAWEKGITWKALIIVPDRDTTFGIEKMVLGKISDLFG